MAVGIIKMQGLMQRCFVNFIQSQYRPKSLFRPYYFTSGVSSVGREVDIFFVCMCLTFLFGHCFCSLLFSLVVDLFVLLLLTWLFNLVLLFLTCHLLVLHIFIHCDFCLLAECFTRKYYWMHK